MATVTRYISVRRRDAQRKLESALLPRPKSPYFRPHPFWGTPSKWPDDSSKYTFLARAVDRYGRALFGEFWIGVSSGGIVNDFPSTQDRMFATRAEVLRAARLLQAHAPSLWNRSSPELIDGLAKLQAIDRDVSADAEAAGVLASFEFSDEQWEEARSLVQNEPLDGPDPATQWEAVLKGLLRHLRDESLQSAVRDLEGGASRPLSSTCWDTEAWRPRFERCQIDEVHPLRHAAAEDDPSHLVFIYVATHELDEVVRPVLGGRPEHGLLNYVPPYLDLLLKACRQLDVKPGSKPSNAEIRPVLKRLWQEAGGAENELTSTLQDELATVLRPPTPSRVVPKKKLPRSPDATSRTKVLR